MKPSFDNASASILKLVNLALKKYSLVIITVMIKSKLRMNIKANN